MLATICVLHVKKARLARKKTGLTRQVLKMNDKKFIQLPREKIADFCKRNRIRKLSLFGSALKGELRKESDIDLLVEFQPGGAPSLLDLARMERELSTVLDGRK